MKAIIVIVISSLGGWLGWWLGYHIGLFTALCVSMLGTGAGIYFGRRLHQMIE
ncbi:MAG: hypothetical protein ACREBV_07800 [Candidatus Zixiibacteriota bacterium]